MRRVLASALGALAVLGAAPAIAHHSFAVFFDQDKPITVAGVVKDFQFANPHGVITFVSDKGGKEELWRAETNAPVILRRLGWSRDSLKPGDKVSVEGWAARDGSNYMRMRKVTRADGTPVGIPIDQAGQK